MRPSAAFRKALSGATVPFGDPVPDHTDREVLALQLTERLWHLANKALC